MKWMDMKLTSTGRRGMDLLLNRQCSWEAVRGLVSSSNLIIKQVMLLYLNTISRKDFLKSMFSVQVVALCTPGQCHKTSFLTGSNFMPADSSMYTGELKQQAPE